MNAQTRTSRSGFTIPELIVVTSVAILLLGSLAPALSMLRNATQTQAAINTVSVAITAARAYATVVNVDDLDGVNPNFSDLKYSGTAMLFTPAGELRLVQNDQLAKDGSGNGGTYLQQTTGPKNGYADIPDRDYIKLPQDAGVVGIARSRANLPGLLLLTPPFAVRFDQHGGLIAGQRANPQRVVYYDSNYNNRYSTSFRRTSAYNPDSWDPNSPTYVKSSTNWDDTKDLHKLPFEEIETVVGVVIYSKRELRKSVGLGHQASTAPSNPINSTARDWILTNGTVLLFSRYSGALIKQP